MPKRGKKGELRPWRDPAGQRCARTASATAMHILRPRRAGHPKGRGGEGGWIATGVAFGVVLLLGVDCLDKQSAARPGYHYVVTVENRSNEAVSAVAIGRAAGGRTTAAMAGTAAGTATAADGKARTLVADAAVDEGRKSTGKILDGLKIRPTLATAFGSSGPKAVCFLA
jgi:hypothetical protein